MVFGNVRVMNPEHLRCKEDEEDWRLVIDYPFDDGQFGPSDDAAALDKFVESGGGSWTLVWLPSFLVQVALGSHLLVFRALRRARPPG